MTKSNANTENISDIILQLKRDIRDLQADDSQQSIITILSRADEEMTVQDTITDTEKNAGNIAYIEYGGGFNIGQKSIKDDA